MQTPYQASGSLGGGVLHPSSSSMILAMCPHLQNEDENSNFTLGIAKLMKWVNTCSQDSSDIFAKIY